MDENNTKDGTLATSDGSKRQDESKQYSLLCKLAKTLYMDVSWICLGMWLEISGPTLQDLMYRVDSNYEEISRALVGRSVGFFIGSFSGGYLSDAFRRHVDGICAAALMFAGLATAIVPFCTELGVLWCMFFLQGLTEGILAISGNALFIRLWGKNAAPPVFSLHFSFGIGALLSPLIAKPFLSDVQGTSKNITANETFGNTSYAFLNCNTSESVQYNHTCPDLAGLPPEAYSTVEYAYIIIAACCVTMGIVAILFQVHVSCYIKLPKYTRPSFWEIFSPGSCTQGDKTFGMKMFVLLFFFNFFIIGIEHTLSKMLFSYATDTENHFSKDEAAILNSVYWAGFTVGRGSPIFFSKWVPPVVMMIVECTGNILSAIALVIWGHYIKLVLYIAVCSYMFFLGPMFASCLSWANHYIEITGMVIAVIYTGCAIGGFVLQWLGGYLFEYYGPRNLMYVVLSSGVLFTSVFFVMYFIGTRHGDLYEKSRKPQADEYSQVDTKDQDGHKEGTTKL